MLPCHLLPKAVFQRYLGFLEKYNFKSIKNWKLMYGFPKALLMYNLTMFLHFVKYLHGDDNRFQSLINLKHKYIPYYK